MEKPGKLQKPVTAGTLHKTMESPNRPAIPDSTAAYEAFRSGEVAVRLEPKAHARLTELIGQGLSFRAAGLQLLEESEDGRFRE